MRARRDKFLNEKLVIFRMHETISSNYVGTILTNLSTDQYQRHEPARVRTPRLLRRSEPQNDSKIFGTTLQYVLPSNASTHSPLHPFASVRRPQPATGLLCLGQDVDESGRELLDLFVLVLL